MYDDRTNLTRQVANDLREFFQNQVFQTIIPRSVRLAEAPSFGQPILTYDPRSKGRRKLRETRQGDPRP
jgi:chromosome partitioning protein